MEDSHGTRALVGATLGHYVIGEPLGVGGMGVVYAATHRLLERPAAVKVLLPAYSTNTDVVQRFFNEARAVARIRHPGIVEIYDFGYHVDGCAYIAMERLFGRSLTAVMAAGPPSLELACELVRQIASVIQAAHDCGIVHRDLKPDNVFVVEDPEVGFRVKVLDFGIAKLEENASLHKTQTGMLMGTPAYMAPEQCRGVPVDHRADLYALGCIAFELVTGKPPFQGEGSGDLLAAHIYLPPPSARACAPRTPRALDELLTRLLAKDPAQRPPSAQAIVSALDAIGGPAATGRRTWPPTAQLNEVRTATTLSGAAGAAAARPVPTRRRWLVGGVAVFALAAVALVLARSTSAPPAAAPPPPPPLAAPPVDAPPDAPPDAAPDAALDAAPDAATAMSLDAAPPEPRHRKRPRKRTAPATNAPAPTDDIVVDELEPPTPAK